MMAAPQLDADRVLTLTSVIAQDLRMHLTAEGAKVSAQRGFEALNALASATAVVLGTIKDKRERDEARMWLDAAIDTELQDLFENGVPGQL